MTDLYIFVTVTAGLIIILGKAVWALQRPIQLINENGVFFGLLYTIVDGSFWVRLINFAADFAVSTFIAVGVRVLITTRISAAIIGTMTILISIVIWIWAWQLSRELE